MTATKEVVEALTEIRDYIRDQLNEYERTKKTYYYPSPENIIGELDSRIESLEDELFLKSVTTEGPLSPIPEDFGPVPKIIDTLY